MKKVLIAGGATGGHIYPAIAIANIIKHNHPSWEVQFAGRDDCMEADIVPREGYKLNNIRIYGFERYYSKLEKMKVFFKMFKGLSDARKLVKTYNPDIVIGTGGFVSGPVVLAGARAKKATLIHEQNALPGFTTKTLSKWTDIVCSSFENTKEYVAHPDRVVHTGNPVRHDYKAVNKKSSRNKLGIAPEKKVVVSFGGSLGAGNINKAMLHVIEKMQREKSFVIYHITGKDGHQKFIDDAKKRGIDLDKANNINILDYAYNLPLLLSSADLAVARSGAGSIAEISYCGVPAIYIPYPFASDDHQKKNAEEIVKEEAGLMILDENLDGHRLHGYIEDLFNEPDLMKKMSRNAKKIATYDSAERILDEIEKLLK